MVLQLEVYHILKVNSITLIKEGGAKVYEKFAELLDKTNKTAYQVSKDTGIGQNIFSNWKAGRSNPKADKLKSSPTTSEYLLSTS